MLDQNTDRSWWMIGAIIIGGALVGLCKVAFPQVFNKAIAYLLNMIPNIG